MYGIFSRTELWSWFVNYVFWSPFFGHWIKLVLYQSQHQFCYWLYVTVGGEMEEEHSCLITRGFGWTRILAWVYSAYWVGQKVCLGFSIRWCRKTRKNFLANLIKQRHTAGGGAQSNRVQSHTAPISFCDRVLSKNLSSWKHWVWTEK